MTTIQVNGTKISFDSVSLFQATQGHHTCNINCNAKQLGQEDQVIGAEDASKLMGKEVVLKIKDKNKKGAEINFTGIVTGIQLYKHFQSYDRVELTVKGKTILADSSSKTESYTEKSLGDLAKELLKPVGKLNVEMTEDPEIPYCCQYRETAFDFISRIASKYGHWFYYDGSGLILGKYQKKETIKMKLGPNIGAYSLALSMLPLASSNLHYDYLSNEVFKASSFETPDPKLDRFGKVVYDASKEVLSEDEFSSSAVAFSEERDLKNFVGKRVGNKAAKLCQLHGDSDDTRIQIGTAIDLIDSQDNSIGTYHVYEVSHSIDEGHNYSNYFKALPSTTEMPPYNSSIKIPKAPNQVAVVKDNNDPDGLGRVKVKFPWQGQNETTPWIRVLNPYAGAGHLYFVPEKEDEVLVGFEFQHADRPIVIGSMYHGKSEVKYFTEENTTQAIHTKSGHRILFEDGEDSQISILTKDDKHSIVLTLVDDGCINIITAGALNLDASEINMKADNINIEATDNLSLKASGIEVEAQQGVKIKGTNASMEGQAEVSIKGAQAKVEGDATTTIKGGIVQIN